MRQKIWAFLHAHKKEFFRYVVVGTSGVAIDMLTLVLFVSTFGWTPLWAVKINQLIVLIYNFTLNKYWSFGSKGMPHVQAIRYALLAGANYLYSVGAMYVFTEMWSYDYRFVRILSIATMVFWNFLLYKYWVYHDPALKKENKKLPKIS